MLDKDLAQLYGVKAIRLREQVKRNFKRFPPDFMFPLTQAEAITLVSQNAIPSKRSLGGALPYVFTEQGVAMLSSVLNNEQAIMVNIAIMRVFVKLKETIATHKELAQKIAQLEERMGKKDEEIQLIFQAIQELMTSPKDEPKKPIGFHN